ncbi:unnamed protein product, partial [marine sediment metagenome]
EKLPVLLRGSVHSRLLLQQLLPEEDFDNIFCRIGGKKIFHIRLFAFSQADPRTQYNTA